MNNSVEPAAPKTAAAQFNWRQLDSREDYSIFIANLRAIGCPENTIGDIVRGNVGRAFAWQRAHLKIDDSGSGPWSRVREVQLVNNLLGESSSTETAVASEGINNPAGQKATAQASAASNIANRIQPGGDAGLAEISSQPQGGSTMAPSYLAQNGNWSANASQPASASQPQQPLNGINGQNPYANTPASGPANSSPDNSGPNGTSKPDPQWTTSAPSGPPDPLGPDDPYALSAPERQINEFNQYQDWLLPQVTDNSDDGNLNINQFLAQ